MMKSSTAEAFHKGRMLWIILLSTIFALGWTTPIPLIEDSEEIDEPCFDPCYCEVKESLFHIHCDSKGFTNISQITESWSRPFKLYLQRNSMRKLYTNSFLHLNNAVSINLGNNALQDIQSGAFNGLKVLKRLYLHENKLDIFRNDTFLGLESLEYLQADYNVIKRIESGAFRNLSKLRVLILNDNLIPILPTNLFRAVSLTHLDLRGNRLKVLPYRGMLDHVGRTLMEIQLEENPWNCTCEIVQLKTWLERVPYTALVGDITCETPFHFHGKDLREIRKAELCPLLTESEVEASLGIPQLSSSKENTWPTKPSSMLSSVHFTASSVEYKSSNRQPKPTKQPRTPKPPPTSRGPYPGPNQPPVAAYQTRPPIPIICPTGCICSLHINDLGLTVNCKERGFSNISELLPRPLNAKKLYLSSNLIQKIYRSDFWNFSSLELLHLGNNRISYVQDGAFINLPNLKSLFLNGNDIERLTPGMFRGLQSLHYLYFEFNVIREIRPAAFSLMPNLKLLFLNNNLLRKLPTDAFAGTSLARLNLRKNYFLYLPVAGVLEHLNAIVQIDLNENPWDCTCDLVPLKQWMETISSVSVVGDVLCGSPENLTRRDVRTVELEALCPEMLRGTGAGAGASPALPGAGRPPAGGPTGASPSEFSPPGGAVPLSVLILSLLVLFFSAVFIAAGLFAFVLRRRRKKLPFRKRQEGVDLTGIQMQCHRLFEDGGGGDGGGGGGGGGRPGRASPEKAPSVGHVYDYIPHPVTQMCNNPIYKPREEEEAAEAEAAAGAQEAGGPERGGAGPQPPRVGELLLAEEQFSETAQENPTNYRTLLEKEKEWTLAVSSSQLNTIVTRNHQHPAHPHRPAAGGGGGGGGGVAGVVGSVAGDLAGFRHHEKNGGVVLFPPGGGCGGGGGGGGFLDRERPQPAPCMVGFVDCLYSTVPKLKELHVHPPGMQYPDLQQDARLKETLLFSAGKGFSDHQTQKSEYLELRAKLQTKPDYLEVLEKTTYRF
ncbi:SLIT and NTRK-like protein 3 [Tachyglossus aculeatus]|uniref:SLIT and NTRK-like protein 3 n=1 Tax=Tachyglossus aculeatus TaxID=9261 RepID=UPI0018F3DFFC|nr:SLIT and NTRK-like protein 3 [Tachyglossus aculeatus]XP_038608695.1 SLIT and NTRK-like protein 3 [Tachyglossus aculeatus]XP_038608700.1 SLIT and NTRK-like protein 3 [Tachyglossus aculeatus]XP_038608709.1 SLIT and NTRK-like protein 3 [Tachyglossus aculeatus]XP_038608720.1 SLIT and NTRK-like protein 3 [Tachyglossus aculeatus]